MNVNVEIYYAWSYLSDKSSDRSICEQECVFLNYLVKYTTNMIETQQQIKQLLAGWLFCIDTICLCGVISCLLC